MSKSGNIGAMVAKIRVLTDETINKIAAGEVIENSASVVKELVENSLDAGSTEIHIEIKGGGRQLIRVTDNGCGMGNDDALLCLERHATSKIREAEDIEEAGTLGFRGEAIPSIASISKFTLLTCPHDEGALGTMVIIEGGRILKCCPAARSPGTTIEVKGLFYNVPVRRKFQRSPAHDTNEVLKTIGNLALAHPGISFELITEQESLLRAHASQEQSPLAQLSDRIVSVLGREFVNQCTRVEFSQDGLSLVGFIGLPTSSRPNRTGQYLFINGRAVVAPLISFIVRDAYGTALPANRHPLFVLHLTIPGELVDVNVHPQKREVRLRQNEQLKQLILGGIGKALQEASGFAAPLPPVGSSAPRPFLHAYESTPLPWEAPTHTLEPLIRETLATAPVFELPSEPAQPTLFQPKMSPPKILATIRGFVLLDPLTCPQVSSDIATLVILDQRAAHQRILFERLRNARTMGPEAPVQQLLIPETLELTTIEAACLREMLPHLRFLGLDIDEFGQNTFLVRAVPAEFDASDVPSVLSDLVEQLREFNSDAIKHQAGDRKLSMAANRLAINRNRHLNAIEAQHLVEQLFQCEMPLQCPQGRPTIIGIGEKELSKQFQS